jgi:hypothetical protein
MSARLLLLLLTRPTNLGLLSFYGLVVTLIRPTPYSTILLTVRGGPEYRLLAFPVAFLAGQKFGLAGLTQ